MKGSVLEFPSAVNTPSPEVSERPTYFDGRPKRRPAATALTTHAVLHQARKTRNVIKVARNLGVRCNDVFLIVLDCLDERSAA